MRQREKHEHVGPRTRHPDGRAADAAASGQRVGGTDRLSRQPCSAACCRQVSRSRGDDDQRLPDETLREALVAKCAPRSTRKTDVLLSATDDAPGQTTAVNGAIVDVERFVAGPLSRAIAYPFVLEDGVRGRGADAGSGALSDRLPASTSQPSC
ncbi:hypothetical protein [Accumulibacter sp.]|uniref:hypothetical protein n=1 Tax=Accumulibacter sp. TaxID=2053492 RepID=UPI0034326D82